MIEGHEIEGSWSKHWKDEGRVMSDEQGTGRGFRKNPLGCLQEGF